MMKYFKGFLLFFLLILPFSIFGTGPTAPDIDVFPHHRTMNDFMIALYNLSLWLFYILLFAGVVGVLTSAFMFIMAGGEPGKVSSARQILIYSLIAVLIGGLSLYIVQWAAGVGEFWKLGEKLGE